MHGNINISYVTHTFYDAVCCGARKDKDNYNDPFDDPSMEKDFVTDFS